MDAICCARFPLYCGFRRAGSVYCRHAVVGARFCFIHGRAGAVDGAGDVYRRRVAGGKRIPTRAGNGYRSFKGLLLGLFFISVGMSLNLGVLYTHILWVAVSVIVLVVVKALVLYVLARLNGMRSSERMQFAGVLSGGEFAFVLFSTASSQRLFQSDQMALLLVAVTLSMMTTPLLMKLIDKWLSRQINGPDEEDENLGWKTISRR